MKQAVESFRPLDGGALSLLSQSVSSVVLTALRTLIDEGGSVKNISWNAWANQTALSNDGSSTRAGFGSAVSAQGFSLGGDRRWDSNGRWIGGLACHDLLGDANDHALELNDTDLTWRGATLYGFYQRAAWNLEASFGYGHIDADRMRTIRFLSETLQSDVEGSTRAVSFEVQRCLNTGFGFVSPFIGVHTISATIDAYRERGAFPALDVSREKTKSIKILNGIEARLPFQVGALQTQAFGRFATALEAGDVDDVLKAPFVEGGQTFDIQTTDRRRVSGQTDARLTARFGGGFSVGLVVSAEEGAGIAHRSGILSLHYAF